MTEKRSASADEVVLRALKATAFRAGDWLFYRYWPEGSDELVLMVNASDFFHWASADAVEITPENIDLFESTIAEVKALGAKLGQNFEDDDVLLFAARARGMRPQGAHYKHLPKELWSLFDGAGPARDVDTSAFGNPVAQPLS